MVGAALRRTLSMHEVTVVTSGEAALAAIDGEPGFDVVICDVMMPGLTGPELYLAVHRAHPRTSERFIFITGGVSSPDSERSLKSIGRPVIPKPFDLHAMRELVQGFEPRED